MYIYICIFTYNIYIYNAHVILMLCPVSLSPSTLKSRVEGGMYFCHSP